MLPGIPPRGGLPTRAAPDAPASDPAGAGALRRVAPTDLPPASDPAVPGALLARAAGADTPAARVAP